MKWILTALFAVFGLALQAQTIVAAHAIRARSIIGPADLAILDTQTLGGISDQTQIVGKEARVNLYAGRAILLSEIGPPAILDRNQLVMMIYNLESLTITTEGRVLSRAGVGERVRVMNLDSRMTVTGRVTSGGAIEVNR